MVQSELQDIKGSMRVPRGREEENRQIIGEEAPLTELSNETAQGEQRIIMVQR